MVYAIITLSIVCVILFFLAISKRDFFKTTSVFSDKDIEENARKLALSLRMPESVGASPKTGKILKNIKSAYFVAKEKIKQDEDLYEFERWIYENYFSIITNFNTRKFRHFSLLPHKNKKIRILEVADFIVNTSYGKLEDKNISKVIDTFNTHTPLHIEEIFALKDALKYILVSKIGDIAQNSKKYYKMQQRAKFDKHLSKKNSASSSYLYWYKRYGKVIKNEDLALKSDININNIEYSFSSTLIDNAITVGNCVISIKNLKELIDTHKEIDYSYANKLLMADSDYQSMDLDSKVAYLRAVEKVSNLFNITEKNLIDTAFYLAKKHNVHFGCMLFEYKYLIKAYLFNNKLIAIKPKGGRRTQRLFSIAIFLFTTLISAIFFFMGENIFYSITLALIGWIASLFAVEFIIIKIHKSVLNNRPMPKVDLEDLPDNAKTMVVMPVFIADEKSLQETIDNIKIIRAGNFGKNISFSLLVDYKGSDKPITSLDLMFNSLFSQSLENYEDINVFVRRKSKIGNRFCGFERKRGAILSFNEMLLTHDTHDFSYIKNSNFEKPEYIVVLDNDNKLLPNSVKNAVKTIMHPLNSRYDLLTFSPKYNMYTMKTLFSRQFYFDGGYEKYNDYSNFYFDMSRFSIFCGKGIYRLASFQNKLKERLPNNKVLSHDIIEGAILKTGASNVTVFEDVPNSFVSDFERHKRWMRGDIQLVRFISNTFRNAKGERVKTEKEPIYNYIIFSNFLKTLTAPAQLILLLIPLFTLNIFHAIPFIFSFILIPFINLLQTMNGLTKNIRPRYVIRALGISILRLVYEFFLLPIYAVNNLVIFISTLWRMAFNKSKLLEWKTFAQSQGENNGYAYVALLILPFIAMAVIAGISFGNLFVIGYAAIFYALSIASYGFSKITEEKYEFTENEKNQLMMYARQTYKFFCDQKSEQYLIYDNYQIKPYKGQSAGTSPTNISFSLLAEICAFELGIIDIAQAQSNIINILKSTLSLKRYKGHLYNWYKVDGKQVLAPYYISSVDSGNFLAGIITVKQFLIANNLEGIEMCDKLLDVDMEFLYDKKKSLFHIGYNTVTKEYGGHYDLLASEARILYYIASSYYGFTESWFSLNRDVVSKRGNTLLSWSGTMFEYLMPEIFLDTPKYSLLNTTVNNAIGEQIDNKCKGVWGISESGYYKYDNNLNYQYYAFGLSSLAHKNEFNRCVISPYSAFLALPFAPKASMRNLSVMLNEDIFGEYGFFEAIDFTNGKNVIYSYMAHHQGMIISSLANALCGNVISKYFMQDERIRSGALLLTERQILTRATNKENSDFVYEKHAKNDKFETSLNLDGIPQYNLLSNGKYSVLFDDFGNSVSKFGYKYIGKFKEQPGRDNGLKVTFLENEETFSISPLASDKNFDKYKCVYSLDECIYLNAEKEIKMNAFVPHCICGEVRKFTVYNNSDKKRMLKAKCDLDIALNDINSDLSHPAFNDLFISTTLLKDKSAIIAHRKLRDKGEGSYCAICVCGLENPQYESNRYNLKIQNMGEFLKSNSFGDVLYPCFHIEGDIVCESNARVEFYAVIMASDSYDEIVSMIDSVRESRFAEFAFESAKLQSLNIGKKHLTSENEYNLARILLQKIQCERYSNEKLNAINQCDFQKLMADLGLSITNKTVLYNYTVNKEDLKRIVNIARYLNYSGADFNLIIKYKESDIYHSLVLNAIKSFLKDIPSFIKLVESENISKEIEECVFLSITDTAKLEKLTASTNPSTVIIPQAERLEIKQIEYSTGMGGYDEQGNYLVTSKPLMPYSNVICAVNGGTIVTENGGGYTYFGNSREEKSTLWENDPIYDTPSESIYIGENQSYWRVNKLFEYGSVTHGPGITKFLNKANGITSEIETYLIKDGNVKIYEVAIINNLDKNRDIDILLSVIPCLGWRTNEQFLQIQKTNGILNFYNPITKQNCYVYALCDYNILANFNNLINRANYYPAIEIKTRIMQEEKKRFYFALSNNKENFSNINASNIQDEKQITLSYFQNINKLKLTTNDLNTDYLFNRGLLYQVVSARLNGRCGYYQAGGAIGFRDQLQDCLAMLYSDLSYVREHIIECAKRQYIEGDVMHWWHPPYFGVRTQISDDKLFLPYLVCEYVKASGDYSILNEKIPYLVGDKLDDGQESRLEHGKISNYQDTLLDHCKRAIESALKYGKNGLLLIGSGDWNDALNHIGLQGRGESVWLTMFAYMAVNEFINILPSEQKIYYLNVLDNLYSGINNSYSDGWYRRATTDNGEWLGDGKGDVCKIDLLCQSFAVLCGACPVKNYQSAMKNAEDLIDKELGLVKLLSPPFNKNSYYGYISSYPEGVRENGGQYTHATAWYIKALAKIDRNKAFDIFNLINPVRKCATELNEVYKVEPYVMSADVYLSGQGGWSWYTGSASWLYKILLEDIIGIRLENKALVFELKEIRKLGDIQLQFKWGKAVYDIKLQKTNRININIDGVNFLKSKILNLHDIEKTYNVTVEY